MLTLTSIKLTINYINYKINCIYELSKLYIKYNKLSIKYNQNIKNKTKNKLRMKAINYASFKLEVKAISSVKKMKTVL